MRILTKTVKLTGAENTETVVGMKVSEGLVFVLENRGPGTVDVVDIGPIEPNSFVVIGGLDIIKISAPTQFTSLDVTVFTK